MDTRNLATNRYILKELEDSDLANVHRGLSDPKVTKYYDVHFPTLEATKEQMEWYANLKKDKTGLWWAVFDKTNNEFCGAGGYNSLEEQHQKAEIGFWLLPSYWGKGIMAEVMPLLFDLGFTTLGLNRIEGLVLSENFKCKRSLEKINFKFEGTMREWEIKDGIKIDIDIYAILKRDWISINAE